jgi:hypothetical protein
VKVTAKAWLHWHASPYDKDGGRFTFFENNMSVCGPEYVGIREVEVEQEVPDDFDPRPEQIAALREKKKEILATAQAKANNIDELIQTLLAIEFKG